MNDLDTRQLAPPLAPPRRADLIGHSAVLGYMVGGSFILLFLRYLSFHFDSMTMNFGRFLAGFLTLLAGSLLFPGRTLKALRLPRRTWLGLALVAVLNALAQLLFTEGIAQTSATIGAMVVLLGVPLAAVAAFIFFADERRGTNDWRFIAGAAMALLGTIIVALECPDHADYAPTHARGVFYLIGTAFLSVAVAVLYRRLLRGTDVLAVSIASTGLFTLIFLAGTLCIGQPQKLVDSPPWVLFWLYFSGAVGIVAGIWIYFIALHRRGVIATKFAELAMPALTALWSWCFLREPSTITQLAAGATIIAGCLLLLRAQSQQDRE